MTSIAVGRARSYSDITASMPGDPAASLTGMAAGSVSGRQACAGRWDLDWVPDKELDVVPDALYRLCARCPLRAACLAQSVVFGSSGYWAGTTTADRRRLTAGGTLSVSAADRLRTGRRNSAHAMHPVGGGSMRWYRRGCHCEQCRRCNAHQRSRERNTARTLLEHADQPGQVSA